MPFRITGLDEKLIKNNFIKKIIKKNKLFLVIEENNKLFAYFFGEISNNKMEKYGYKHNNTRFGYVENVYIEKKYRDKGYFKEFSKLFEEFLKKNKIKYCELHVAEKNDDAIKIYEKQGFRTIERRMRKKL